LYRVANSVADTPFWPPGSLCAALFCRCGARCFWARVEPENARHDFAKFFWQRDFAPPAAVSSRGVMVDLHVGVKRRQQIAQLSVQHDRPLRRAAVHHRQVVLLP